MDGYIEKEINGEVVPFKFGMFLTMTLCKTLECSPQELEIHYQNFWIVDEERELMYPNLGEEGTFIATWLVSAAYAAQALEGKEMEFTDRQGFQWMEEIKTEGIKELWDCFVESRTVGDNLKKKSGFIQRLRDQLGKLVSQN